MKFMRIKKENINTYLLLVIMGCIYVFPVLWSGRYYKDDLARTLYGVTGWKGDGRPVGEWLIVALTGFQNQIDDIAPLSWLLAILILAYGLTIYAQNCLTDIGRKAVWVIPLLFVITNPFAIENWSYRYDCIIMFTAVSIVFLLYALPKESYAVYALVNFIASVVIMSVYQAAIGMCIVLAVTDIFLCLERREKVKEAVIYNSIGMLMTGVGAIVYKFTIARYCIDRLGWQNQASELVQGTFRETLCTIYSNIKSAFDFIFMVWSAFSPVYLIVYAILIVCAWGIVVYICYQYGSAGHKLLWSVLGAALPLVAFGGTFLPLVLLNSLQWDSKKFLSFGGFGFFVAVVLLTTLKKAKGRKVCLAALCICLFQQYTYMNIYGNTLKNQREYDEYLVHSIVYDLDTISSNGDESILSFDGEAPRSRVVTRMCGKYPHFEKLVPSYFTNDTWMGGAYVYRYVQDNIHIESITEEELAQIKEMSSVIEHTTYSCYKTGNKIIIKFMNS